MQKVESLFNKVKEIDKEDAAQLEKVEAKSEHSSEDEQIKSLLSKKTKLKKQHDELVTLSQHKSIQGEKVEEMMNGSFSNYSKGFAIIKLKRASFERDDEPEDVADSSRFEQEESMLNEVLNLYKNLDKGPAGTKANLDVHRNANQTQGVGGKFMASELAENSGRPEPGKLSGSSSAQRLSKPSTSQPGRRTKRYSIDNDADRDLVHEYEAKKQMPQDGFPLNLQQLNLMSASL